MRYSIILALLLVVFPTTSLASSKSIFVVALSQENPTSVYLQRKADFASITITITSDQKDPIQQISEIRQARQLIMEEAKRNGKLRVHTGPSVLTSESASSFSKGYSPPSQSELALFWPLQKDEDVFRGAEEIHNFLAKLKPPGKSSFKLSPIRLAVENPEQYRSQIIKLINDDIQLLKGAMKNSDRMVVSGLQSPVVVRQVDDINVEIFIRYSLSVETK